MYKHNDPLAPESKNTSGVVPAAPTVEEKIHGELPRPAPSGELLRELLEKNLKWSQIIYEQNRKISRRLTLAAVAQWLRLIFIVIPLVVGTIFLIPFLRQVYGSYSDVLGMATGKTNTSTTSIESIMKYLPVSTEDKQKIQQMLK